MIRFSACSVTMGTAYLLRDINLEIDPGAFVSIVGPNGAGKSTLLKALLGLRPLSGGTIEIAGKPLVKYGARQLARTIGYVPQGLETNAGYTVYELVMMGRYASVSRIGGLGKSDHEAVVQALAMAGVSPFSDRFLHSLSGGERQRVWLAAAMVQQPDILLLDEPLTYLDPKHQLEMMTLLGQIHRQQRTTILTVSHHLTHAFSKASHVLALKHGQLAFYGTRPAFLDGDHLEQVFDLPFTVVDHPQSGHPIPLPAVSL